MKEYTFEDLENAAAIAANIHSEPARYTAFYDEHGTKLGGFPGIWSLCATAGAAFGKQDFDNDDWIQSIDRFSHELMKDPLQDLDLLAQKIL